MNLVYKYQYLFDILNKYYLGKIVDIDVLLKHVAMEHGIKIPKSTAYSNIVGISRFKYTKSEHTRRNFNYKIELVEIIPYNITTATLTKTFPSNIKTKKEELKVLDRVYKINAIKSTTEFNNQVNKLNDMKSKLNIDEVNELNGVIEYFKILHKKTI